MSGALAFAALALAVGAEDDEVGAMWARLGPTEIPHEQPLSDLPVTKTSAHYSGARASISKT